MNLSSDFDVDVEGHFPVSECSGRNINSSPPSLHLVLNKWTAIVTLHFCKALSSIILGQLQKSFQMTDSVKFPVEE